MTGFGRGLGEHGGVVVVVELRSVNHRYLDLRSHLPVELNPYEGQALSYLKNQLIRGRVDVNMRLGDNSRALTKLHVDAKMATQYQQAWQQLAEALQIDAPLDLPFIASQAGVWQHLPTEDVEASVPLAIQKGLEQALQQLLVSRRHEGEQIGTDIRQRLSKLSAHCQQAKQRMPIVTQAFQQRLSERVRELIANQGHDLSLDQGRLITEVALLAERADATEELVRLESHIASSLSLLSEAHASGRKLDFLCQEMLREINTLGSKANDLTTTELVVELKAELERVREQVQNLE